MMKTHFIDGEQIAVTEITRNDYCNRGMWRESEKGETITLCKLLKFLSESEKRK